MWPVVLGPLVAIVNFVAAKPKDLCQITLGDTRADETRCDRCMLGRVKPGLCAVWWLTVVFLACEEK